MKLFISSILFFLSLNVQAQVNKHGPPCGAMDILDVGIYVDGFQVLKENRIRYSEISTDSVRNGFELALQDTSYQIEWFLIVYSNTEVVKEYPISGSNATIHNAEFLKSIKQGDKLSIECINIKKGAVTSISTGFFILVSN
jgi:hypothetical protein